MASDYINNIICSVVIPHYNIPDLLCRCIQSIPDREDIQIIVVDDCSPKAKNVYNKVNSLNRSNVEFYSTPIGGSAGRARNIGIEKAKGRWITFLDSDDLFSDYFENVIESLYNHEEDILYFHSKSVMSDDLSKKSVRNIFDYHFQTYFDKGNEMLLRFEFDAPWGKIIKRSFIISHNIRFDEVRYSNDTYFSTAIGLYAKKIYVSSEKLYIVTERGNSLTSGKLKNMEEWDIRYNTTLRVQEFLDDNKVDYRRYAFSDFLMMMMKRNKHKFIKEFFKLSIKNKVRFVYSIFRKYILK